MSVLAFRSRPSSPAARQRRAVLVTLLRREIRGRYKGSVLGLAWTFVLPISVVIAYSAIFHYVYKVVDIPDYPLFLLSGMVGWFFFAAGAQGASESIVGNANLVKKVRFPRQLIPFSAVAGHGMTMLVMLALLVPANLIFVPDSRSPAMLMLPVVLALLGVMTYGFGLIVAALNVYFRDVQYILGAILLPWFFLTPIFYTPEVLPKGAEEFQWLTAVLEWGNFVAPYVIAIRDSVFFGEWPSAAHLVYCAVCSAAMFAAGEWVFRRLEGEMAVEL
jgi:ABC-type polysaccharide/polyol phosphate export permease